VSDFGWGRNPVPLELRSDCRVPLFHELIQHSMAQGIDLVVLPGGFFRTDYSGGIVNALKQHPPKISVLVGCDDVACGQREVWVVAPNGRITRRIPEAWISTYRFSQAVLDSITDRRFQLDNKMYAVFCCGDVLIDKRKAPITYSKAAFVLAHNSANGRQFTPSMRKLKMPAFLSQHVKHPYNTVGFAYNGNSDLQANITLKGKSKGMKELKWIARIYSV